MARQLSNTSRDSGRRCPSRVTLTRRSWRWSWTIGTVLAGLLAAAPVSAQDAALAPPVTALPTCDPAVTVCLQTQGWLLTLRTWTPGGAAPRDLVGGRLQSEVRWHRWRWAARGDATGIPGEYRAGQWETVRSLEVHAAAALDALRLPHGIAIGPAAGVGAALVLAHSPDGIVPVLPKAVTAGLGFRASWSGGWLIAVVGQHQALRGVAAVATWEVRLSDRVSTIGQAAVGSRSYTMSTGVGVRAY